MVFTLHRYILWELLKVFVLATVALTLILSLGSILKPIQDYGVGPAAVIKLLGYFLPITLTFVLPIAAVFAASLVYGRFASDNELDACRASGIGLWTCIYPGLALAISVAIANLLLSFYVVPNYVHRAERAIKADAKQILFRNIERKGFYTLPSQSREYRIYADLVDEEHNRLEGVIVAEGRGSQIRRLITARAADVYFEAKKHFNDITIVAYDASQFDEQGQAFSKKLPLASQLGSLLSDNIKFKEVGELQDIRADIMKFDPVSKLANETYTQLAAELLAADLADKIDNKPGDWYELASSTTRIKFSALHTKVRADNQIDIADKIVLIEDDNSQPIRQAFTYQANRAALQVLKTPDGMRAEMVLFDAEWARKDGTRGIAQRHVIPNLFLPAAIQARLGPDVLPAVTNMPAILASPTDRLKVMQTELAKEISSTLANIDAEVNLRLAFGIGCIALILIGSGLGVVLKGGHLLTAFGASSVPAALLIVCLLTGKNIATHNTFAPMIGLALMWVSVLIIFAIGLLVYRKLMRT